MHAQQSKGRCSVQERMFKVASYAYSAYKPAHIVLWLLSALPRERQAAAHVLLRVANCWNKHKCSDYADLCTKVAENHKFQVPT